MKKKIIQILPCFILLVLFSILGYSNIMVYYETLSDTSGLIFEDFDQKLRDENERAIDDNLEYGKLLGSDYEQGNIASDTQGVRSAEVENLNLHALSALLLDASNNRVLYEENGYKRRSMASTTKIMTCIIALENGDLSDVVNVSSYAASMPDVQLGIRKGEQYYLKDCLYSLMMESHNDVAVAIAEHVGGSVEGFATMMNDKARELGCEDTNFVTANGLDANGHYTTARDLAVIASYAISNEQFIEITNTSSYVFKELTKGRGHTVTNKNRFLYMMEGAIGVKTGFTSDAGYCFVGAIKRQDKSFISVVLGCGWPPSKSLKWSDTKELMNYGIKYYKPRQIFEDITLEPVLVKDGQEKYEILDMEGNLTLLMRDDEKVRIEYELPQMLQAPVKEKTEVGKAKYYIDDILYEQIPIYTTRDIAKIDFKFCLKKIFKIWSLQY